MRCSDDIGLDHEVVVEEFGRACVIGENAPDLSGCHDNGVRLGVGQKRLDLALPHQVDDVAAGGDDLAVLTAQPEHHGASDHASVTSNPDALSRKIVGHGYSTLTGRSRPCDLRRA